MLKGNSLPFHLHAAPFHSKAAADKKGKLGGWESWWDNNSVLIIIVLNVQNITISCLKWPADSGTSTARG
jgi:hypothetical protein